MKRDHASSDGSKENNGMTQLQDSNLDSYHQTRNTRFLQSSEQSTQSASSSSSSSNSNMEGANAIESERPNTYKQGYIYPFRFILLHFYSMVKRLKKVERSGRKIEIDDLPILEDHVRVEYTADQIRKRLDEVNLDTLTSLQFMKIVGRTFKKSICEQLTYIILENITKLFSPVCTAKLITLVKEGDFQGAFWWSIILILTNFLGITLGQNGWAKSQRLSAQLRLGMINLLYEKVSNLSAFSVKKANVGKIINMISSDFNSFESKGIYIFNMVVSPITLTASSAMLCYRLGYSGILAIILLIGLIPLQKRVAIKAGEFTKLQSKSNDSKIKLFAEMMDGIRIIKMYGWERAFRRAIMRFRSDEIRNLLINQTIMYIEQSLSLIGPLFVALICFLLIDLTDDFPLNTAIIFSTIELLNLISLTIMKNIGFGLSFAYDFKVLFKRFIGIIAIENVQMKRVETLRAKESPEKIEDAVVQMNDFSAYWYSENVLDKEPVLQNVDFMIRKGEAVSIIGAIGSGKTSLLFSIMKEIPRYTGSFFATSNLAFAEQEPFLLSGSIRENILFGKNFDPNFYNTVVEACCLLDDFAQFPQRDHSSIGERGSNLSGGQKARVCLARAVYANSDLYLLDDPLSAVDSKVAKKIFTNVIKGLLKDKAVILVTHQLNYAMKCDRIVVFENGLITTQGNPKEIDLKSSSITRFIENQEEKQEDKSESEFELMQNQNKMNGQQSEKKDENESNIILSEHDECKENIQAEVTSINPASSDDKSGIEGNSSQKREEEFVVSFKTYTDYIQSNPSPWIFLLVIFTFVIQEFFFTSFYKSLSLYEFDFAKEQFYLIAFGILSAHFVFKFTQSTFMSYFVLTTNKNITEQMVTGIASARPVILDEIPAGQIINKFSNDITILDKQLPDACYATLEGILHFFNLIGSVVVMNYWFIIPGSIEVFYFYRWFKYIKPILMRAKQLDLENKTPVFQFFQSTLNGVLIVNVYGQKIRFQKQMQTLMNNSIRTYDIFWFVSRIFSVYMQYMALLTSAVGIIMTLSLASEDHGKFGQALVFFLLLTNFLHITLRAFINMDTFMTSSERANSILNLPAEEIDLRESPNAQLSSMGAQTSEQLQKNQKQNENYNPLEETEDHITIEMEKKSINSKDQTNLISSWPSKGELVFENVFMKYKEGLKHVLKGVNFNAAPLERVAIVGRTGAGKSSIIQALFRMSEIDLRQAETGSVSRIFYDNQDTRHVELQKLRRCISIIPQTPFVFSGSIRRNIDPLEEYSDREIQRVLSETGLTELIQKLPEGILTDMSDSSSVFSVGQRQLVCLARVMLRNNKLIVLDEATANVDMETDEMIQNLVKEKFKNCTIITIAHRLNTIADYDKVIVLNDGVVIEMDAPFKLLVNDENDNSISNSGGVFAQMVNHTGSKNAQQIFSIARQAFLEKKKLD